MGDIVWGFDFKNKRRFEPIKSPLQEGLETIARGLALDCPPEIVATIYESSLGFIAPDKGPA